MIGLVGGALGALSGYMQTPNYNQIAQNFTNQMQGLSDEWNPYLKRSDQARKGVMGLNAFQMMDPTALENREAASFTNSPYQNQILTNTQNQMNNNAAMTGMMGSTSQDAALQNDLAGQENQWQQQYINRGTNQYNQADNHLNNLANLMMQQGFSAQQIQDELRQQAYFSQAQMALQPSATSNALSGFIGGMSSLGGMGGDIEGLF